MSKYIISSIYHSVLVNQYKILYMVIMQIFKKKKLDLVCSNPLLFYPVFKKKLYSLLNAFEAEIKLVF